MHPMDEENNWDLQALVRSCCFVSNGSSSSSAVRSPKVTFTSSSSSSSFDLCSRPSDEEEENKKKKKKKKNSKIDIDQLFSKELEDLYKPFLIQSPSTSSSSQATRATPKQVTGLFSDDASRFKKRYIYIYTHTLGFTSLMHVCNLIVELIRSKRG